MVALKRKIWKGAKAKKKAKTVNITTQNLRQEVAKQGTGKTMFFRQQDYYTLPVLTTGTPKFAIQCFSAPFGWTQTFDNNADTGDQKIPRAQLKAIDIQMSITMETPGLFRMLNVYIVAMKTDLFTYLNGAAFDASQMTDNETHTTYGNCLSLNPSMFDIKHHWVRYLGDNTAKSGSPAGGNLTNDLHSRNVLCTFSMPIDIAYQAGVRGWTSIAEQELPASKRLYWIVAQTSVYGGTGEASTVSVYSNAIFKVVY